MAYPKKQSRRILVITTFDPPPIPDRNHDWSARLDSYEPGEPIGYGSTEADAVYDLYIEIELAEEDEEVRTRGQSGGM